MVRFQKGSAEAKEWAKKMREARGKKVSGGAVAPPSRMPESSPAAEMAGGKVSAGRRARKDFNKLTKGLAKAGKATQYANPMMWAVKDKGTSNLMAQSGDFAYNTALPAVVEAGRPLLDVASTAVAGPLGKEAADMLYDEMVTKKGYDPRSRQKSETAKQLGRQAGKFGARRLGKDLSGKGAGSSRMLGRDVFREVISNLTREDMLRLLEDPNLTAEQRRIINDVMPPAPPDMPIDYAPRATTRKKIGRGMAPPSRLPESSPDAEMAGAGMKIGQYRPTMSDKWSNVPIQSASASVMGSGMCMECDKCMGMGIVGSGGGASRPAPPTTRPYDEARADKLANDMFQYASKLYDIEGLSYKEVLDFLDGEIERHRKDGYITEARGYRAAKSMFIKYKEGV
jgi:hypothetical protein